jgi:hypothetical protein
MATAALLLDGVLADPHRCLSVEQNNVLSTDSFFLDAAWATLWERARELRKSPTDYDTIGRASSFDAAAASLVRQAHRSAGSAVIRREEGDKGSLFPMDFLNWKSTVQG